MRTRSPWRFSLVVGVLMLFAAGCSDPVKQPSTLSDETSPSVESSGPTTTTSNQDPQVEAVSDQYKGYYNAIYSLQQPTDDQVRAAFSPFATPEAVEHWVGVFQAFAADGQMPKGSVQFGPLEVSIRDATATVVECRDSTSEEMVLISSGKLVAKGGPGTKIESNLAQDASGRWLVFASKPEESAC